MSKNNSSLGVANVLEILKSERAHIHFVGVGGVSMSSLFELTKHFGISASGCDANHGKYVDALIACGCAVSVGDVGLPEETTLVVYSLAVSEDDKILHSAFQRGIPCVSRAEYLGAIMKCYGMRIGVSGSHGKSTVTSMLAKIFSYAGLCPTVLSGAELDDKGLCYSLGSLDYLVYEACEYKDSFLSFSPSVALFLNVDYDHVDYFSSLDAVTESFANAAKCAELAVINGDDGELLKIAQKLHTTPVIYGKKHEFKYCYKILSDSSRAMRFSLYRYGKLLGCVTLSMIGDFNVGNAVAATVCALECGVSFNVCAEALRNFKGIGRRLELIGKWNGRPVYYDYAHHPTEIKAGIKAIKCDTGAPVTVIFGPHTYSRTKRLWSDFVNALNTADNVILTEIDPAREKVSEGVNSAALARDCNGCFCQNSRELLEHLVNTQGAIVIMGAANMTWVKNAVLNIDN